MFSDSDDGALLYYLGYAAGLGILLAIFSRRIVAGRWQWTIREMLVAVACISLIAALSGDWLYRIRQVRLAQEALGQIGGSIGERLYLRAYNVHLPQDIGDSQLDAIIPYLASLPEVDIDAVGSAITPLHAASLTHEFPHCHIILKEVVVP